MAASSSTPDADPVRRAALARRSWAKVTQEAPERGELRALVAAASRVADHSGLRPWRLIELRGSDRELLGQALVAAAARLGEDKPELATKPLRAPLLLAVVASRKDSEKVPHWEQDATAAGAAHLLSLLLDEAGWGVMWRTGGYTRSEAVRRMHRLDDNEELLGWLYVGGKPELASGKPAAAKKPLDPKKLLHRL